MRVSLRLYLTNTGALGAADVFDTVHTVLPGVGAAFTLSLPTSSVVMG
jgi:hypothetical protein